MNVMFAGLTAVGKTTHSSILARQLGFRVVSATDVLLRTVGLPTSKHPWFSHLDEIERRRDKDHTVDDAVDEFLITASRQLNGAVFDTWALPWLSQSEAYRIKLVSTDDACARKAFVSQGLHPSLDHGSCIQHLAEKNTASLRRFYSRHKIDLADTTVFDVVIDNSELIREATFAQARAGILALKPLIHQCVLATTLQSEREIEKLDQMLQGPLGRLVVQMRRPLEVISRVGP